MSCIFENAHDAVSQNPAARLRTDERRDERLPSIQKRERNACMCWRSQGRCAAKENSSTEDGRTAVVGIASSIPMGCSGGRPDS
jgi:hypothetical protein